MNKTLTILLLLSSVAGAQSEQNLLWNISITDNAYQVSTGAAWTSETPYAPKTQWSSQDFTTMPGYVYNDGTKKISFEAAALGIRFADTFTLSVDCSLTGNTSAALTSTTCQLLQLCETLTWQFNVTYDTQAQTIGFGGNTTVNNVQTFGTYSLADITNVTLTMDGAPNKAGTVTVYLNGEKAASGTMVAANRHNTSNISAGLVLLADRVNPDKTGIVGGISSVSLYNSNIMVPEPTTATLSLLALAGLAARRRR